MANFIYLKTSTESPIKGDITPTGIIFDVYFPRIYTENMVYENKRPTILLPMLIIDAPEDFLKPFPETVEQVIAFEADEEGESEKWANQWKDTLASAIPFHSNEQVYEWLKSKGITPEAEGLYEFDGEIKFKYFCFIGNDNNLGGHWHEITERDYCGGLLCPQKKKVATIKRCRNCGYNKCSCDRPENPEPVAIIKPTANEESEEVLWGKAARIIIAHYENGDMDKNDETLSELKQHFKIERR